VQRFRRGALPGSLEPLLQPLQPLAQDLRELAGWGLPGILGRLEQRGDGPGIPLLERPVKGAFRCAELPLVGLEQGCIPPAQPCDLELQIAYPAERVLQFLDGRVQLADAKDAQRRAELAGRDARLVHGRLGGQSLLLLLDRPQRAVRNRDACTGRAI